MELQQETVASDNGLPVSNTTTEPEEKNIPTSSLRSYGAEWESLFGLSLVNMDRIKRCCFQGQLQGSRFRSICWRLLLGCLPRSRAEWLRCLKLSRESYGRLKEAVKMNPRLNDPSSDPSLNNPLSLADESPWQQYFADSDLTACIQQDVERTFPELEYFQSGGVREMMVDILFVYAKDNPEICYKQGMHEILGPLLFVLFFDQQAYSHASEMEGFNSLNSDAKEILSSLTESSYLEHDAYTMFTKLMQIIKPWYVASEGRDEGERRSSESEPFLRPQDSGPTNALVSKLNWVGDTLLCHADPHLYKHLESLEIAPQIYGIRWLRLLFGREFPIQDLLFLWDAIFADGGSFVLVDYIFVAMLIFIRDLLLHSDYTGCLQYLMRYPPVADVHSLLSLSLHLRNPQVFHKPQAYASMNFSHITVAGRPHPNLIQNRRPSPSGRNSSEGGSKLQAAFGKNLERTGTRVLESLNKVGNIVADSLKDSGGGAASSNGYNVPVLRTVDARYQYHAGSGSRSQIERSSPGKMGLQRAGGRGSKRSIFSDEELDLMKEQVSCLQMRLNDLESTNFTVADKLSVCADILSSQLVCLGASPENEALKAVGDLRNICRILKGARQEDGNPITESISNSPVEIGSDAARATPGLPARNTNSRVEERSKAVRRLNAENELKEMPAAVDMK